MAFSKKGKVFNPFGIERGKVVESDASKAYWQQIDLSSSVMHKNPQFDLKKQNKRVFERSMVLAISLAFLGFMGLRALQLDSEALAMQQVHFAVEEIPVTQQIHRPPPPERPAVPIPSDDEEIPEDLTIDETEIVFSDIPLPPDEPPADESSEIFVVYDTPPTPKGGFSEIYKHVVYPQIAVKAGLEGLVYVKCLVDVNGNVAQAEILRDSGSDIGFEAAAIAALKKVEWIPAMQRDQPVMVWVSVPVRFRLTEQLGL